jgi:hypothetical protein
MITLIAAILSRNSAEYWLRNETWAASIGFPGFEHVECKGRTRHEMSGSDASFDYLVGSLTMALLPSTDSNTPFHKRGVGKGHGLFRGGVEVRTGA